MIIEILLILIFIDLLIGDWLYYKNLKQETKDEIAKEAKQPFQSVLPRPETKLYTYKPPVPQEVSTLQKVLKKINIIK